MLILKLVLLVAGAALAIHCGPFPNGDGWAAVVTGMTFVAAVAIQNAIHRTHLATSPPTTLMTGTTTQVMIDLADLFHGLPSDSRAAVRTRLRRMSASVMIFALGCGTAALTYSWVGVRCFAIAPGRVREPALATDLDHRHAGLGLLEEPDDLFLCEFDLLLRSPRLMDSILHC